MLKTIVFVFSFLGVITVHLNAFEITEPIRVFLSHVKLSDLPESVRSSLSPSDGRAANDASHWCCVNEQPVISQTQTKIEQGTRTVSIDTKVGYIDCGLFGWMKCSHYTTSYESQVYTYIQTFQVPAFAACNSSDLKCCSGYIKVADDCHSLADLSNNRDLLQLLVTLGLLPTSGVGK